MRILCSTLLILALALAGRSFGQSLWLEGGLAYQETTSGTYQTLFKFGARGVYPLTNTVGLYGAAAWRGGMVLEAGGWFSFPPGLTDLFGLHAYAGVGGTYVAGELGLALSVAVSYDIAPHLALTLDYTHRPLFYPKSEQAFDVNTGLRLSLP